jgi:hypothetical protein
MFVSKETETLIEKFVNKLSNEEIQVLLTKIDESLHRDIKNKKPKLTIVTDEKQ